MLKNDSVLFSYHAAQRLKERLGISVSTDREYNIANSFIHSKTYFHHTLKVLVESWIATNKEIALIVAKDSRVVLSVLNEDNQLMRGIKHSAYH